MYCTVYRWPPPPCNRIHFLAGQVTRAELEVSGGADETKEGGNAAVYHADQIDETSFLVNLIDSPGHVDFSSEVRVQSCSCFLVWLLEEDKIIGLLSLRGSIADCLLSRTVKTLILSH